MSESEKLKKQIDDLISSDIMSNAEREDMTPTMSDIYYWGYTKYAHQNNESNN